MQFLAGLAPALSRQLYLACQLLAASVLVEQAAVGVRLEQRLMLVLAVQVGEFVPYRRQDGDRHDCAAGMAPAEPYLARIAQAPDLAALAGLFAEPGYPGR